MAEQIEPTPCKVDGDEYFDKIKIEYHRHMAEAPEGAGEFALSDDSDYYESLTLDGTDETIEYVRENDEGSRAVTTCSMPGAVSYLLDWIPVDAFSEIEGNPPDAPDDPSDRLVYAITLYLHGGGVRTASGTFDRKGLPTDWPIFITNVRRLLQFFLPYNLFDERLYGKVRRSPTEPSDYNYIFCHVVFEEGGRSYCYLADRDDYREGDRVIVPVGPENREVAAEIESIESCAEGEETPFPVERTKHILRKCESDDEDEDDEVYDDEDEEDCEA